MAREKFWVFSLLAALLGVVLLVAAENGNIWGWLATLLESFAGLLLASVALGALWEYTGRRAFLDLIMERVDLAKGIERSGLLNVTNQYLRDVPWDELIDEASHVDLLFSYARTWRSNHQSHLKDLCARAGARVRVVLPDNSDSALMDALARSYDKTPTEVADSIGEAADFFEGLEVEDGAEVRIYRHRSPSAYAYYRFDQKAVITLYRNSVKKGTVPVLYCRDGGVLYQMTKEDFEEVVEAASPWRCD